MNKWSRAMDQCSSASGHAYTNGDKNPKIATLNGTNCWTLKNKVTSQT